MKIVLRQGSIARADAIRTPPQNHDLRDDRLDAINGGNK